MIILNSGRDLQAVAEYLRTAKRYSGILAGLSTIGSTLIVARLDPAYDFQENVIKALIESDKSLADDLSQVDYDGRLSIVDETYRLFAGTYPGY